MRILTDLRRRGSAGDEHISGGECIDATQQSAETETDAFTEHHQPR